MWTKRFSSPVGNLENRTINSREGTPQHLHNMYVYKVLPFQMVWQKVSERYSEHLCRGPNLEICESRRNIHTI